MHQSLLAKSLILSFDVVQFLLYLEADVHPPVSHLYDDFYKMLMNDKSTHPHKTETNIDDWQDFRELQVYIQEYSIWDWASACYQLCEALHCARTKLLATLENFREFSGYCSYTQLDSVSAQQVLTHFCKTTVQCITLPSVLSLSLSCKAMHVETWENHQCPERNNLQRRPPQSHKGSQGRQLSLANRSWSCSFSPTIPLDTAKTGAARSQKVCF